MLYVILLVVPLPYFCPDELPNIFILVNLCGVPIVSAVSAFYLA